MFPGARTLLIATALTVAAHAAPTQSPQHDKAFWRAVAEQRFAVPEGESVDALARELSGLLGSSDPELRDDIAYSALAAWIYRERSVSPDALAALREDWIRTLSAGVGERGTDSVFRRSFSALALALVVAADNQEPFLARAEFERLLRAALTYLAAERDVRGFDAKTGWMHSVAHTADLLKFLARSRHLDVAEQRAVLDGIAAKLGQTDEVLTHGEDERLARVAVSIAARPDVDRDGFARWLSGLAASRPAGPPTPATLAIRQNIRNLVVSLHAVLTTDARDLPGVQAAREIVRRTLKEFVQ